METRVTEIADNIYRFSTYLPQAGPGGFTFNQFLVDADEPLLFHTGLRHIFPLVSEAVARVLPLQRLRWITFGHFEADECGAMNQFLAASPQATVAHGSIGVMVSIIDQADRPPRSLSDGEILDLGGKRMRRLETPHVPHGWDAGLFYEETTGTLFAGDFFARPGDYAATTESPDALYDSGIAFEEALPSTALTPQTQPTIQRLAALDPRTLALMHNSAYSGNCSALLLRLAEFYGERLSDSLTPAPA
jgi:flavorubredoxin